MSRIEVDMRTKEQKREDRREARRRRFNDFCEDVRRNKDVILIMSPFVIGGIAAVTKVTCKALNAYSVNKEVRFKQCTIYDRSLGRYIELKRPLTSAEALTIEERRLNGEKLHKILEDLGLLKNK
jgi:hypothetical protein